MGMNVGGRKGGAIGEINITPMIDVLLVLLIIFMVVQQALMRQAILQLPPPDGETPLAEPDPGSLVLVVEPGGRVSLNRQPLDAARLEQALRDEFAGRERKVLFVKGEGAASYGEVIAAVDASVQAGVQVIGLAP